MEVKTPESTDWIVLNEFLDKNLRSDVEWSLKDEYPLALSEKNIKNIKVINDEGQVVAHAVVQPTIVKTHYHVFKVGLIGSVVTDEDRRGQGMSKNIINSCIQQCEAIDCDIAMLWTDMFNFYAQFGFEVAGSEIALQADSNFKGTIRESLKILDTPQVSPQAILKLFNQHQLRSHRQIADIAQFLKIPNTEVYTAWNQLTNTLEAYCIIGKGADFTNYIHEWGGNVSSIVSLVKYIVEKKKTTVTLITPPQNSNLINQMSDAGAQKFFGVLGMMRIINPQNFCKKIKKGARALGYNDLAFEYRDGKYYFGFADEIYCTDSDQDIVRLVFGPNTPEKIHQFNKETIEAFKEIFPIPFWIWGWDSI